jgi:hypothetical protein
VAARIGTRTSAAKVGRSRCRGLLLVMAIWIVTPLHAVPGLAAFPVARLATILPAPASTPERAGVGVLSTEIDDDDDSDDVGALTPRHLAADGVLLDGGAFPSPRTQKTAAPTGPLLAELAVAYAPEVRPPIHDGVAA